jgi:hypothetical protein
MVLSAADQGAVENNFGICKKASTRARKISVTYSVDEPRPMYIATIYSVDLR